MSKILKTVSVVCLTIISLFLTGCNQIDSEQQQHPEAIEGVIDLRQWDF
jgi:PBP1b-binding outer membrane lipoprotein LpoB